ncbi:S8 family serine peptidase [Flaviramulus sp. BrNp1-15]|uniref:S8 family serine peptidase n=1 Tax=Flaviramulus sp. BrNp1-15 TaxID=2916754 RepID=UPI001EE99111|nr:S8 family serine peptidase [Flaviramulus sp. BrNp1-15]ULC59433.1 S8 family serine peptidase [Flaviramulus sp. BrNp1-15]
MDPKLKLIVKGNPREELQLLLRLKSAHIYPKHCKVISQFGDIISCRILRKDLLSVYDDPATRSLKAPQVIPADFYDDSGYSNVINKVNRHQPKTKKSPVVFGIIDFGFDFSHPDFLDNEGKTRFEKIWVQPLKQSNKNKYGYGEIFNDSHINNALKSREPFKSLGYHPGRNDFIGRGMHGTHVLGIAASSGVISKKSFAGNSPIVAVDMGSSYVNGSDLSLGDSVKLIEGLDFILKQAGNRPCVINMSLGGHCSDHTGNTLVEIAFNNILKKRGGTVIVQSTGNYFLANCHNAGILSQDETIEIEWLFKARDRSANEIEIWYENEDRIAVELLDDEGNVFGESFPFQDSIINYDGIQNGIIFHRHNEPNSTKNHINIILSKRPDSRRLIVRLKGIEISNGEYHAYIERDDVGQSYFSAEDVNTNFTIGSICNAPLTIAVGAYNQEDIYKTPMHFSSAGPTIDRRIKPEILAAGNKIVAAKSAAKFQLKSKSELTAKSGSSMASPYVASLAVKVLEHFPKINIYELRQLLFKSCTTLNSMNKTIINKSGYGVIEVNKLNTLLKLKKKQYENNKST